VLQVVVVVLTDLQLEWQEVLVRRLQRPLQQQILIQHLRFVLVMVVVVELHLHQETEVDLPELTLVIQVRITAVLAVTLEDLALLVLVEEVALPRTSKAIAGRLWLWLVAVVVAQAVQTLATTRWETLEV
jgi:hypothetical protein